MIDCAAVAAAMTEDSAFGKSLLVMLALTELYPTLQTFTKEPEFIPECQIRRIYVILNALIFVIASVLINWGLRFGVDLYAYMTVAFFCAVQVLIVFSSHVRRMVRYSLPAGAALVLFCLVTRGFPVWLPYVISAVITVNFAHAGVVRFFWETVHRFAAPKVASLAFLLVGILLIIFPFRAFVAAGCGF